MAQQGGTRDPKKIRAQQAEEAKKQQNGSGPSQEQKLVDTPGVSQNQDNKTNAQDWDIVKDSEEELKLELKPRIDGVSSQFNFQVGWGKWKWDLSNWDVEWKGSETARGGFTVVPSSPMERNKEGQQTGQN